MHLKKLGLLPHHILPKKALTELTGLLAEVKQSSIKNWLIKQFISLYQVNMQEALYPQAEDYENFNAFFIRPLRPGVRTIADTEVVSPVDGSISQIGRIDSGKLIQAKGHVYSMQELLAQDTSLVKHYEHGLFSTLYLSPKDYHRVHMPIDGRLSRMTYVPGTLFSVKAKTTAGIKNLFCRNERLVMFFDTALGEMAMVMVGATIVGAIGTVWEGDIKRSKKIQHFHYVNPITLEKGQEMGYFKLGSTVILLFANQQSLGWEQQLQAGDPIQLGMPLARLRNA